MKERYIVEKKLSLIYRLHLHWEVKPGNEVRKKRPANLQR